MKIMRLSDKLKEYMNKVLCFGEPTFSDPQLASLIEISATYGCKTLNDTLLKYREMLEKNNVIKAAEIFATLHMFA